MPDQSSEARIWLIVTYVALGVICAGLAARGFTDGNTVFQTIGALGLVVVLATAPIAATLQQPRREVPRSGSDDRISELVQAIQELGEQGALSDDARRVLNRRRERELLRAAIEEDLSAEDWDAAMVLVKELAERFGYRSDAEEFRSRIETARYQGADRRVEDATNQLDRLIMQLRWDEAFSEAARIGRLFPDSPRVEGLRHRVEASRMRYKSELERRFLHAAQQESIDEAMELLKELDQYLTPNEAEPYREVARGVIGKARENLGVQFKLAIQDRQWKVAAEVGERVLAEFPNTRMAQEIREMLDNVRDRAAALS